LKYKIEGFESSREHSSLCNSPMRKMFVFSRKKAIKEINSGTKIFFDRLCDRSFLKTLQEKQYFTASRGYRFFGMSIQRGV